MKRIKRINPYHIMTEEAFDIYSDSSLIVGADEDTYYVYSGGTMSSDNLMRGDMTIDELNEFFETFYDDDDDEMSTTEVIERLDNMLRWCNDNQSYEDAEALEIAIAMLRNKED